MGLLFSGFPSLCLSVIPSVTLVSTHFLENELYDLTKILISNIDKILAGIVTPHFSLMNNGVMALNSPNDRHQKFVSAQYLENKSREEINGL